MILYITLTSIKIKPSETKSISLRVIFIKNKLALLRSAPYS